MLLLDTHILIWFVNGDEALPQKVKDAIKNVDNKCYVSMASIWEIAIKKSLGKLHLNIDFHSIKMLLAKNDIDLLPVNFEHI